LGAALTSYKNQKGIEKFLFTIFTPLQDYQHLQISIFRTEPVQHSV